MECISVWMFALSCSIVESLFTYAFSLRCPHRKNLVLSNLVILEAMESRNFEKLFILKHPS